MPWGAPRQRLLTLANGSEEAIELIHRATPKWHS